MSDTVLSVLVSGLVAAFSALAGAYITNRAAQRRQELDIQQKERELWSTFILPTANRRVSALEEIYDTLQHAIEVSRLEMAEYKRIRRLLIYIPGQLQGDLIEGLVGLVDAVDKVNRVQNSSAVPQLKKVQAELRRSLGLPAIEEYVINLSHGEVSPQAGS